MSNTTEPKQNPTRLDWYWVSLEYATFGLGATNGVVTSAPPISMLSMGRQIKDVLAYYRSRGAEIVQLELGGGSGQEE